MIRRLLATTASAAALALGLASAASAQTTVNGGGANSEQPIFDTAFAQYTNNNPAALFSYDGVGSGPGQTAFLTHAGRSARTALFCLYAAGRSRRC